MNDRKPSFEADEILSLAGIDSWSCQRIRPVLIENANLRGKLRDTFRNAKGVADGLMAAVEEAQAADLVLDQRSEKVGSALARAADKVRAAAEVMAVFGRAVATEPTAESVAGAEDLYSLAANSEQLLPQPPASPDRVSMTESMRALGVLEALSKTWDADAVIGVNRGGSIVSNYLEHRLSKKLRNYGVVLFKDNRVDFRSAHHLLSGGAGRKVLIVDDISRTGRTLKEVHAALTNAFPTTKFECASLVSAIGETAGAAVVYGFAPIITTDTGVSLPWWTKGKLIFKGDRYFFGSARGIPMLQFQAEEIQRELSGNL